MALANLDGRRDLWNYLDEITPAELTLWQAWFDLRNEQQTASGRMMSGEEFEKHLKDVRPDLQSDE